MIPLNKIIETVSDREARLLKDPKAAYKYAANVIQGPWPEAEPIISTDITLMRKYIELVVGANDRKELIKKYIIPWLQANNEPVPFNETKVFMYSVYDYFGQIDNIIINLAWNYGFKIQNNRVKTMLRFLKRFGLSIIDAKNMNKLNLRIVGVSEMMEALEKQWVYYNNITPVIKEASELAYLITDKFKLNILRSTNEYEYYYNQTILNAHRLLNRINGYR